MARRQWPLQGHLVELEYSRWFGEATLRVDGELIFCRSGRPVFLDRGFCRRFEIASIPCAVRVTRSCLSFHAEFLKYEAAEAVPDSDLPERAVELVIMNITMWMLFPVLLGTCVFVSLARDFLKQF